MLASSHLTPNMQEGAAATVDGVLRAAINKQADDVGQQSGSRRHQNPLCIRKKPRLSAC
jgi:hypothetical protein